MWLIALVLIVALFSGIAGLLDVSWWTAFGLVVGGGLALYVGYRVLFFLVRAVMRALLGENGPGPTVVAAGPAHVEIEDDFRYSSDLLSIAVSVRAEFPLGVAEAPIEIRRAKALGVKLDRDEPVIVEAGEVKKLWFSREGHALEFPTERGTVEIDYRPRGFRFARRSTFSIEPVGDVEQVDAYSRKQEWTAESAAPAWPGA